MVDEREGAPVATIPRGRFASWSIRFYDKVGANADLGPIFERAIDGNWGPHLAKMYDFWSSVMLTTCRYKGNPVATHQHIDGLEIGLFERWLALFGQTCDERFDNHIAGLFRLKAARIAESLKLALFYRPDRAWLAGTT